MLLASELLKENSRYNVNRIVRIVEEDPGLVKELVGFSVQRNVVLSMRASWVLTHCYDSMPDLIQPYIEVLVKASPGLVHTGTRRNVLRMLMNEKIPEDLQGFLFDQCLNWIISKKEPIAVKANAMEILGNIVKEQPDLKNEVIPLLLDIIPNGSMGIISRAKKILLKLGINPADSDY